MKYILLILAFLLASCSSSPKQPMLLSAKAAAVPEYKALGKVEAKSCGGWYFYIPIAADFGKIQSNVLEEAAAMGADAVVDFQIRNTSFFFIPLIFGRDCYTAVGTAVKFASGKSAWDAAPADVESSGSAWDAAPQETKEQETKSAWD